MYTFTGGSPAAAQVNLTTSFLYLGSHGTLRASLIGTYLDQEEEPKVRELVEHTLAVFGTLPLVFLEA